MITKKLGYTFDTARELAEILAELSHDSASSDVKVYDGNGTRITEVSLSWDAKAGTWTLDFA